eukprot:GHVH01004231.1.p2 GENE.GHVH01004231.1~~GHVH01004231.1.p2  ORF type:complete len:268 (+),score=39.72 GHVH01004231.1:1100-1903(+)
MEEDNLDPEENWVSWYCSLDGNEYFCEVTSEFLHDQFVFFGLKSKIAPGFYDSALAMIRGCPPSDEMMQNSSFLEIFNHADVLYGLLHSRFITSADGLNQMREKFLEEDFGCCPRVMCESWPLLPIGLVEEPRVREVKGYCGKCQEVYELENEIYRQKIDLGDEPADPGARQYKHKEEDLDNTESNNRNQVDGEFFGNTFAPFFYLTYPSIAPKDAPKIFEARLYGFRVQGSVSKVRRKAMSGNYGSYYRSMAKLRTPPPPATLVKP